MVIFNNPTDPIKQKYKIPSNLIVLMFLWYTKRYKSLAYDINNKHRNSLIQIGWIGGNSKDFNVI